MTFKFSKTLINYFLRCLADFLNTKRKIKTQNIKPVISKPGKKNSGVCSSLIFSRYSRSSSSSSIWSSPGSWSFMSFLLFYLLMRVFASVYHSVGVATVSRSHPDRALDFAMGVQSASGNLGVFLSLLIFF